MCALSHSNNGGFLMIKRKKDKFSLLLTEIAKNIDETAEYFVNLLKDVFTFNGSDKSFVQLFNHDMNMIISFCFKLF